MKLIDEAYTDDSLKDAAKRAGPECVKKANERAKGKQQTYFLKKRMKHSTLAPLSLSLCVEIMTFLHLNIT